MNKDSIGKAGLIAQITAGKRKQRVLIELHSDRAPAHPGEGVFKAGTVIGAITSAAWGYRTNKNLAMAYVNPEHTKLGSKLEAILLGQTTNATVCEPCVYDPFNNIPRGIK